MAHRRITFAASAVRDLLGIREWYAEQLVPEVGERLIREVIVAVEQLVEFPQSGRIVPEFDVPKLREIIHPPFRVVYRRDGERVQVVRVWRSERLMGASPDGDPYKGFERMRRRPQ